MIKAYDREADAFRCFYTQVVVGEDDISDPFHFCFDHYIPVRSSHLVLTTDLVNSMKNELTEQEFRDAVDELLLHRDGKPFDVGRIAFRHWTKRAPALPEPGSRLSRGEVSNVLVDACIVCGAPPRKWSYYCNRCRRLATYRTYVNKKRAMALKAAWSKEQDGFLCAYTGVKVDEWDAGSPWAFCIDHAIPGDEDSLVVSS
jgi:hypothetical protein